jgi:hypothetical protein
MFNGESLEFESEDDLRKPVPDGTVAHIRVRADSDGTRGNFKSGESQYGPWMIIPFEVINGDHQGLWVNMMMNLKTSDFRFRKTFETVTDMDVSKGGAVSFGDFKEKLLSGVFEAELGPEKRKGEETGYTRVNKLVRRVGENDATEVASDVDVPAIGINTDVDDDDIPF